MAQDQMRRWAAIGAERRLVELAEEAAAIYAAFPELRDRTQPSRTRAPRVASTTTADNNSAEPATPGHRRRRRRLSPEARKRISEAQKARWAKQRKSAAAK